MDSVAMQDYCEQVMLHWNEICSSCFRNLLTTSSMVSSATVTVQVGAGENSKTFTVPKAVLRTSPWFDAALRGNAFKEGAENKIALVEDSPRAFAAFVFMLYTGKILYKQFTKLWSDMELVRLEIDLFLDFWLFGDKYGIPKLQEAATFRVCDMLTEASQQYPHIEGFTIAHMNRCFESTAAHALPRIIAADYAVHRIKHRGVPAETFSELATCEGFLDELLASYSAFHELPQPDFPRYIKPIAHKSVLQVREEAPGDFVAYYSGLNEGISCDECGNNAGLSRCSGCKMTVCGCKKWERHVICYACLKGVAQVPEPED